MPGSNFHVLDPMFSLFNDQIMRTVLANSVNVPLPPSQTSKAPRAQKPASKAAKTAPVSEPTSPFDALMRELLPGFVKAPVNADQAPLPNGKPPMSPYAPRLTAADPDQATAQPAFDLVTLMQLMGQNQQAAIESMMKPRGKIAQAEANKTFGSGGTPGLDRWHAMNPDANAQRSATLNPVNPVNALAARFRAMPYKGTSGMLGMTPAMQNSVNVSNAQTGFDSAYQDYHSGAGSAAAMDAFRKQLVALGQGNYKTPPKATLPKAQRVKGYPY